MRSQTCSQCGMRLETTKLERGSKFACSNCGTILIVGETAAVKRSLKDGPAFKPRASVPAPAAETPRRSSRPRAPAVEATSRSRAPLFLGLAVVVIGVVVAIVMSGEKGGGSSGGGGGKSGGAEAWWNRIAPSIETDNAAALRGQLEAAKRAGYDQDPEFWAAKADQLHEALYREDPDDAAANRHLGRVALQDYPGFAAIWSTMNEHLGVLPDELKGFVDRHEEPVESGKKVWLDEKTYAAEKAAIKAFLKWKKALDADPTPEQIQKGRTRAAAIAPDFGSAALVARPFIVLLASKELNEKVTEAKQRTAKESELLAKGKPVQRLLEVVVGEFETRFRKPLDLPVIEPKTAFYVWVYDDRTAYLDHAKTRSRVDILSFFALRDRHWSYAFASDDANEARWHPQDVGHAAVEQLRWFYSKDRKKRYLNYFDEWNGLWFTLGWAEYLGGGVQVDGGEASFDGLNKRRAEHLSRMLDNGVPLFRLKDVVEQRSWAMFSRSRGAMIETVIDFDDLPETATAVLGSEGHVVHVKTFVSMCWFLAYFLNEFESGKYRVQYLDLVRTALAGKRKPSKYGSGKWSSSLDAFTEIMGLKTDDDWARLQRDYMRFLKPTLRKASR